MKRLLGSSVKYRGVRLFLKIMLVVQIRLGGKRKKTIVTSVGLDWTVKWMIYFTMTTTLKSFTNSFNCGTPPDVVFLEDQNALWIEKIGTNTLKRRFT